MIIDIQCDYSFQIQKSNRNGPGFWLFVASVAYIIVLKYVE